MAVAEVVRERLVRRLRAAGRIRSTAVEHAFRAVPRHLFLPDLPVEQAYADEAVPIKWQDGVAISSASQPSMMAIMLEQLDLRPGQHVLEIGAGTGYNAALLAQIVGPAGGVASVDIDCDLVDAAREHLAATDYGRVQLACRDGALGYAEAGPYERIMLTVGSWDVQPAWLDQLAGGGRLLLPLSIQGSQLSVALDAAPGPPVHLRSVSVRSCAFIRMRGTAAGPAAGRWIEPDGLIVQAAEGREVDIPAIRAALREPGQDRPVEVPLVVADLWDGLGLWLAITDPHACRLLVSGAAAESRTAPSLLPGRSAGGTLAVLGDGGLAALVRRDGGERSFEVVARPFGPDGAAPADRLAERVQEWVRCGRPTSSNLRVRVYPRTVALESIPAADGAVIDKEHNRLVLDWPDNPAPDQA